MLTTELFIAIISLCITCFNLGYTVGSKSNDKTQKYRPMSCQTKRLFFTNYLLG